MMKIIMEETTKDGKPAVDFRTEMQGCDGLEMLSFFSACYTTMNEGLNRLLNEMDIPDSVYAMVKNAIQSGTFATVLSVVYGGK